MKPLAVAFLVLLSLSIVSSVFAQQAQALSAVTFTSKASAISVGQQFQRLYENGTNSVIALDGSSTNGTYYKTVYNVAAGTVSSATTTLSGSGNTVNADAFASPVDLSQYSLQLNGSTQSAQAASNSVYDVTTQNFWLAGFFKKTTAADTFRIVYAKVTGSVGYYSEITDTMSFHSAIRLGGSEIRVLTPNSSVAPNVWFAYGASYNRAGNLDVYLYNTQTGQLYTASQNISGFSGSITNSATFEVGAVTGSEYFIGNMDNFIPPQIGSTLSQADFLAFAQNGVLPPNTHDLYDFNEGIAGVTIKDVAGSNNLSPANSPTYSSNVPLSISILSRPTTYITGRDTTTGKNGYAKLNLSDLSKVSDNYQTSSYHPKDIAQSTTKLYSPLYNATSQYGVLKLGQINRDFTSYSENSLFTGNSTVPVIGYLADTTAASPTGTQALSSANAAVEGEKITSTGALVGKTIDSIAFKLAKNNSPTGTATVGTFDASGNVITTFGTLNVATLTTTPTLTFFALTKPYTVAANDRIGIKYTGGDGSNNLSVTLINADVYDGTNSIRTTYSGSWSDATTQDALFQVRAGNIKTIVATDGSPDTTYTAFESGTNTIRVVKYTNTATLLGTALSHTTGQPFSLVTMSGSIIIQTATKTYSLNTSTDAITTLYNNSFNTRYPQPFTISPSARTYNTNPVYIANSTYAINYVPSTGTGTQTGVIISATTAPTLTAYAPSKYYYLSQNSLTTEGATATTTTWTIKAIGSQNQFVATPYSERLGVNLVQNSTLFSQNVFHLVCGSGEYTDTIPYFATGSDSDCTEWRIVPDSSSTVGREIFLPYTRTPDLVHTNPMTSYTFTINSGTPTYYNIKSSYDGKVVDVATFDSSGQASQRYLFNQCYTVQVTNTNSGQSALAGNICANDATTKPIDVNAVQVPVNWQGSAWATNSYRNYTDPSSNTVTFTVDKNAHPWNATIHVIDNQFSTPTYDQWFNYTNQNAAQTITINGINGNQTLYFDGYENGVAVFNSVVSGQGFNLNGLGFTNLGSIFGIPIAGMFVIIIGGVFTRSSATFGFIAVLATIGVMVAFGLLNINPAFWAALMGVAAVGIFAYKRLS